jgi:transcriptional regulator with XRE-family HTH domain
MACLREDPRGSQLINQRRAFGDRLRRQRERLGVSLTEIAETTKVAASLFASLERGDCSRWPGGVYNRAFIRGYARAVKLDPDEMAAEFAECYETPVAEAPPRTPAKSSNEIPARPALRLSIDVDPAEGLQRFARAAALAVADLLAIAALAAVVVLTTGGPLWRSLAVTAIAYHVLVRVIAGMPRLNRLAGRTHSATPEPLVEPIEGETEVPVSGTASTVA